MGRTGECAPPSRRAGGQPVAATGTISGTCTRPHGPYGGLLCQGGRRRTSKKRAPCLQCREPFSALSCTPPRPGGQNLRATVNTYPSPRPGFPNVTPQKRASWPTLKRSHATSYARPVMRSSVAGVAPRAAREGQSRSKHSQNTSWDAAAAASHDHISQPRVSRTVVALGYERHQTTLHRFISDTDRF